MVWLYTFLTVKSMRMSKHTVPAPIENGEVRYSSIVYAAAGTLPDIVK